MINELDKAALRSQMRKMYRDIGYFKSLDCLMEIMTSAECLIDVILDEQKKNDRV